MPVHQTLADALNGFTNELHAHIVGAVKRLLETKHLYQSEVVNVSAVVANHKAPESSSVGYARNTGNSPSWDWWVVDERMEKPRTDWQDPAFIWKTPDIKTYCPTCKRIEAFNSVSSENFLNRGDSLGSGIKGEQVFVLSYLCQSCKRIPQVFLIRKVGNKIILCGRSPMESVDTPAAIPEEASRHYANAVVAHQSGQTLSAIFMLRTLVEQWARLHAASDAYADVALDAYMGTLPEEFNGRFPSLRALYADLSAAMHEARADEDLFKAGMSIVQQHFEARRLFGLRLPEKKVPKEAPAIAK